MKFPLNLSIVKNEIQNIPIISINEAKILDVLQNRNSLISDIYLITNLDIILLAKIFKKINAEYTTNNKISTITEAILFLGFNTLRHIALEIYNSEKLSKNFFKCGFFDFDKYWLHSVAVALFSKKIAQTIFKEQKVIEEYYIAGLFHDIGKMVIYHILKKEYIHVLLDADQTFSLKDIETKFLGFNHCDLGSILANEWNLADFVIECCLYHHNPEMASSKNKQFVYTVAISNLFVNISKIGFSGNFFEQNIPIEWLDFLNLRLSDLESWKKDVLHEIQFFVSFLRS